MADFETVPVGTRNLLQAIKQIIEQYGEGILPESVLRAYRVVEPDTEYVTDNAYCSEYDALFNPKLDTWIDPKCSDPTCSFCTNRPKKPSMVSELKEYFVK